MKMIIRKIKSETNEYMAYIKPEGNYPALTFVYFKEDVRGSLGLLRFYEMNKAFFRNDPIEIEYDEREVNIKNTIVLDIIKNAFKVES